MFTNYRGYDNFNYICTQNAQCWARITKSDMEIQRSITGSMRLHVTWTLMSKSYLCHLKKYGLANNEFADRLYFCNKKHIYAYKQECTHKI